MPLFTHVATFKGDSCVVQGSYSNFKGFVSAWAGELPANALPSLTPSSRKALSKLAYYGDFLPVPNRTNVWCKSLDLEGEAFVVYAVQTQR